MRCKIHFCFPERRLGARFDISERSFVFCTAAEPDCDIFLALTLLYLARDIIQEERILLYLFGCCWRLDDWQTTFETEV